MPTVYQKVNNSARCLRFPNGKRTLQSLRKIVQSDVMENEGPHEDRNRIAVNMLLLVPV